MMPQSQAPAATQAAAPPVEQPAASAPVLGVLQAQIKPTVSRGAGNFVGEMTSKGALHIDGNAKGTVQAESVTVGTTGSLNGSVNCRKFHVRGNFTGNVICDELIIADEANVEGSLTYRSILVQRGARVAGEFVVVDGECSSPPNH